LVKTVTGPPVNLTVTTPGGEAGGAQLGLALNKQPVATVLDASNKPVGNVTVTVGLTDGGGILGCDTGTTCTSATTDAFGKATFSNLVITGLVADVEQTLTFTSGALTATAKVTPTVGVAKNLAVVTPLPVAGQLGEVLTTQPKVKVTDTWGNAVPGATVTVGPATLPEGGTLGCVAPATGCTTATVTGPDGTTTFSSLMITGPVASVEQTLTFSSTGTNSPTAKVTPSAGDAKNLTVETAPVAGQLGKALTTQPKVKVTDEWTNAVSGATVTVALTAGGGTLGCVSPATGCDTAPATGAGGTTTFSSLMITGPVAGVQQTLTFSSTGTTAQPATVTPTAGDATTIIANSPLGGTYGSFAPFTPVSPNPQVKVTDAYGNPIASAGIVWQLASTLTGASLSSTATSTSATGLSSVTWTLGDGGNGLTAFLGTTSGPSAGFTATSSTGVTIAACTLAGTTKKTDLAKFSSTGYKGYFSILSSGKGMIRSVEMQMSVTGQSSGTGNYVTWLRAYRKNGDGTRGTEIATFKPNTSDKTLKLPGSNSSPSLVKFNLDPSSTGLATPPEMLIFELEITAPSTRTFQIWYNTKTTAGLSCATSKLYTPGAVTPTNLLTFSFGSSTSFLAGHALKITN
jgi:hypothetical protein